MIYLIGFVFLERLVFNTIVTELIYKRHNAYTDIPSSFNMESYKLGEMILDKLKITNVTFLYDDTIMTNRYDRKNKVIYLNSTAYYAKTLSGLSVVLHEISHAVFYKKIKSIYFLIFAFIPLYFSFIYFSNVLFVILLFDIFLRIGNFFSELFAVIISKKLANKYKLYNESEEKALIKLFNLPMYGATYSLLIGFVPLIIAIFILT